MDYVLTLHFVICIATFKYNLTNIYNMDFSNAAIFNANIVKANGCLCICLDSGLQLHYAVGKQKEPGNMQGIYPLNNTLF